MPNEELNKSATPAKTDSTAPLDASTISSSSKEVGDIFGDLTEQNQPQLPAKQRPSSVQREKITNSLIALPRPPSRHGSVITSGSATISGRTRANPSPIPASLLGDNKLSIAKQERKSSSPPDLQPHYSTSTLPRIGTSRGPSPLTLGMSDVIPLAVAFQEVCHACFRGVDESQCQVRLIGDMMISFPAGIVQVLTSRANASPLMFKLKNSSVLESLVPNKQLISSVPTMSTNETSVYEFDMAALKDLLKKQFEQSPSASYFNIDILKYQVRAKEGAGSCPLQMVAYWKCADEHTDLRLDYKYNSHAMASGNPLLNISIAVPIDGGVKTMQSKPNGTW